MLFIHTLWENVTSYHTYTTNQTCCKCIIQIISTMQLIFHLFSVAPA